MMLGYLSNDRREELETATPERMMTVFYDQVIENLHTAISAIARSDIQERCNAITAAIELLGEMIQCLELESDDPIINNLRQVHTFIIARLPRVNFYDDAKFAAEAIRLLKPIRDAWAAVDKFANQVPKQDLLPAFVDPVKGRPKLTVVSPVA